MSNPPTIQTNPLDPVFSGVPVVIPQENLVNPTWNKWFVDLREKVNVINSTLAAWSGITPVTGLTPGTYGDTTHYPVVTVNEFGLITGISNQAVSGGGGNPMKITTLTGNHTISPTDAPATTANIGWLEQTASTSNVITIDTNANQNCPVGTHIFIRENTGGTTTINGVSGVTLSGPTITDGGAYSIGQVVQIALNSWAVFGNIPWSSTVTYATLNPADKGSQVVLSGGNLTATNSSSSGSNMIARATVFISGGKKCYWESTATYSTGLESVEAGVANSSANLSSFCGVDTNSAGGPYYGDGKCYYNNSVQYTVSGGVASGHVCGHRYDSSTGTYAITVDGATWVTIHTGFSGAFAPAIDVARSTSSITMNFGASPFTYTVPSGYQAGVY